MSPLRPTVPLNRPATLAMICFAASRSCEYVSMLLHDEFDVAGVREPGTLRV